MVLPHILAPLLPIVLPVVLPERWLPKGYRPQGLPTDDDLDEAHEERGVPLLEREEMLDGGEFELGSVDSESEDGEGSDEREKVYRKV